MKIKVNESEFYQIETKDEYDLIEFGELIDRLAKVKNSFINNSMLPMKINMNVPTELKNKRPSKYKTKNNPEGKGKPEKKRRRNLHPKGSLKFRADRDEAVRVIKLHYFGTKEEKEKYAVENGVHWTDEIVRGIWSITKKFKVKPEEVGFTGSFPHKRGGRPKSENTQTQKNTQPKEKDELLEEVQYY